MIPRPGRKAPRQYSVLGRISTGFIFPVSHGQGSEIKSKRVLLPTAATSLSSENTLGDGEEQENGESRDKVEIRRHGRRKEGGEKNNEIERKLQGTSDGRARAHELHLEIPQETDVNFVV